MRMRLGPLPAREGRIWSADTLALLDALDRETRLPFALPIEALAAMRTVVRAIHDAAAVGGESFVWDCETTLPDLKTLITYWLNIGKLSDGTLDQIGGRYSGDDGERFHARLLSSMLQQLDAVDATYADRLRDAWRRPTTPTTVAAPAIVDLRPMPAPAPASAPNAERR
jgi:hypothetical protein